MEVLALQVIHLIPFIDSVMMVVSKGLPGIKYTYSGFLKVLLWFVFAIYGLLIFMVNWKEVY